MDDHNYEYLVYENYPLLSDELTTRFTNTAIETVMLDGITPKCLKVTMKDATLELESVNCYRGSSSNRLSAKRPEEIQKEQVANMGRLGVYEGTQLIEIPQRFALNDLTTKLVDTNTLLILPAGVDNKFVKFVDQGETEIYEITEKGKQSGRIDDIMEMEMTRAFGIAVELGRYFGVWHFVTT